MLKNPLHTKKMKNKKWLDNFGKADNANESKVSMSEDFVGLGYNTKGRNYSPAWGGQFEQGGTVPIAQNGVSEYMKKKIQEKKDESIAAQYSLPEVVVSAPHLTKYNDPNKPTGFPQYEAKSDDIAEFYKSWVSSPEYERRMKDTGYYETPMYNSSRQSSITLPKGRSTIYLSPNEFLEDVRRERMGLLESTQDPGFIEYDPKYASEYRWSGINLNPKDITTPERKQSVLAHEIAHAIDTTTPYENELISGTMFPTDAFNKQFYSQYSETHPVTGKPMLTSEGWKKREKAAYVKNDPQEFKSDLNALRYLMFDKGIYDIRKGKEFTKKDLEKAKEKLKDNESLQRSLDAAGETGFIKLMNIIAKGDEEVAPIAMNGASMPGAVGFTYARTAGAAPSNSPYAKKTKASAQKGEQVQKNVDSTLENIFEIFDPTGASSWDDVYQSYQKSGMSPETQLEIFGALPLLGKVGKIGKALKASNPGKAIQKGSTATMLQLVPYIGRGTDAVQTIEQAPAAPFFPSAPPTSVGQFGMYAGMPAFNKKEYGGDVPSAQNGQEMKFYQNGLDWKPKSMQDGGEESLLGKTTKFVSEEISDPVTTAALTLLDKIKPLSNTEVYKTIRPIDYPNALKLPMYAYNYVMGNESEPLKTKSGKPHLAEEFWATAMNIPGERQYLKESQYKPSKSKDPDAKYYTIRDVIDDYQLMNLTKDLKPGQKMMMNGLSQILDTKWYSKNATTDKGVEFDEIDPLQRFTLQRSDDGSYISIYDKYDFNNPALNRMMNPIEIYDRFYLPKKKDGGIVKDDDGYLNPNNFGKVVEIDSNIITMEGVNQPLLGISNTGDTKLMKPGKNYKFKGKKVREFPVAKLGINQLDAQPMKKLNQLLNFTNNPDKDNWLDKYN